MNFVAHAAYEFKGESGDEFLVESLFSFEYHFTRVTRFWVVAIEV